MLDETDGGQGDYLDGTDSFKNIRGKPYVLDGFEGKRVEMEREMGESPFLFSSWVGEDNGGEREEERDETDGIWVSRHGAKEYGAVLRCVERQITWRRSCQLDQVPHASVLTWHHTAPCSGSTAPHNSARGKGSVLEIVSRRVHMLKTFLKGLFCKNSTHSTPG